MPDFPFVQFEFTHSIGPPPGRYIIHPHDRNGSESFRAGGGQIPGPDTPTEELDARLIGTADVLVVQIRGAAAPTPKRWRPGLKSAPEGEQPAELSVTVATIVLATRMQRDDGGGAARWLSEVRSSRERQEETLEIALGLLRRGVSAYRLAAADPYVPDVTGLDARTARIGWGAASAVVRGGWDEAFGVKLPKPQKVDRTTQLMPVQAMTAMLNGSIEVLEAEELLLSAIRDLDHGRFRAAAVTVNVAQELLLAELAGEELPGRVSGQLAKVEANRDRARAISQRAITDQLTRRDAEALRDFTEDAGGLIDGWRYAPLGFV